MSDMKNAIKSEIIMLIGEIRHYKFNYIFYNISMLIIYIGIFYSFKNKESSSLILLYGLITWQLSTSALTYISSVVEEEAMLGTLEQMFMTRINIVKIYISKIIVNILFGLLKACISFALCIYLFKVYDDFLFLGAYNLLILILIIVVVFSFYMMGLMFGGLSLYYKRIQSFLGIITYTLLFFTNITFPVNELPKIFQLLSYCFPITWLTICIDNIYDGKIIMSNLLFLVINSIFISLLGLLIFKMCIKMSKIKGNLSHY